MGTFCSPPTPGGKSTKPGGVGKWAPDGKSRGGSSRSGRWVKGLAAAPPPTIRANTAAHVIPVDRTAWRIMVNLPVKPHPKNSIT
jgi:hypothetical protein